MSGITTYQDHGVTTESKGRLIVLLYEGAIKFLRQARQELQQDNWGQKGVYISKALAVIDELDACLDIEAGGDVAANLRRLYGFMRSHLTSANVQRDLQKVQDVIDLLTELNEGWKAITG